MIFHTLRLAARSLRRRPGFSALAIVTIALGAGANAAVSAVAYGILLKPLPFAQPDRLVAVWPGRFLTQEDLRYLRDNAPDLAQVAAMAPGWTFSLTNAGDPSRVTVDRVSGNFFETLGARPYLGRVLRADEEQPGAPKVLALSYRYWRARFNGDPGVIGRTVKLDDVPHEIIAVMPASFEVLMTRPDAWAPLPADRAAFYDKLNFSLFFARLDERATLAGADAAFKALMPRMRAELKYADTFGRNARLEDLRTSMTGDIRTSLVVLAAAVGFILLIAGANLGTLLIARGAARTREFAIHAAIGASRGALVRLQLAEGLLLALAGGGTGLALASWAVPALVAMLPNDTPRTGDIHVDTFVAGAVLAGAVAIAFMFAIAPSLAVGRRPLAGSLREAASTPSRGARRMRGVMVSVQVALALVLSIGAGLMTRTLLKLEQVDPGIDVERILTLRLQPTSPRYRPRAALLGYYDQVLDNIRRVPGVAAAGAIQHLPFSGYNWVAPYDVEGRTQPSGNPRAVADFKIVLGDYFAAVGQPVLAGRTFTVSDRSASPAGVIVNDTFAKRNFGAAAAAVGQRVRTGNDKAWSSILGVVGDVRTHALNAPVTPEVYTVANGIGVPSMMVAIHATGDPVAIAAAVRESIWSVDRGVPIGDLQSMRAMVSSTLGRTRLLLTLLTAFAVAGLTLGAIGIYGVVAFAVVSRRREIGIRIALGAARGAVIRLMLRESAGYAAGGLAAGLLLAFASNRIMKELLYEVSTTDVATYVVLAMGVAALVLIASYAPARRAASVSPVDSLRNV